jgi:hypothetical protein
MYHFGNVRRNWSTKFAILTAEEVYSNKLRNTQCGLKVLVMNCFKNRRHMRKRYKLYYLK